MELRIEITGTSALIQHSALGIDTSHPLNLEKANLTRKKGSNRTAEDDRRIREIETELAFWLNRSGQPIVPAAAMRSCMEIGARKVRQGPQVREGLIVLNDGLLQYDKERYGTTLAELVNRTQFTTSVVVQRSRLLRTRPMFDLPWSAEFNIEYDTELVDKTQLENWLDIAGRRIGLGDWRPEKSGLYGRFTATVTI